MCIGLYGSKGQLNVGNKLLISLQIVLIFSCQNQNIIHTEVLAIKNAHKESQIQNAISSCISTDTVHCYYLHKIMQKNWLKDMPLEGQAQENGRNLSEI